MSITYLRTPVIKFPRLPGARCNTDGIPPDDFFAEELKDNKVRSRAKRFCRPCPVRKECLQWALANDEQWGIWGGLDSRERRKLKKQQAR